MQFWKFLYKTSHTETSVRLQSWKFIVDGRATSSAIDHGLLVYIASYYTSMYRSINQSINRRRLLGFLLSETCRGMSWWGRFRRNKLRTSKQLRIFGGVSGASSHQLLMSAPNCPRIADVGHSWILQDWLHFTGPDPNHTQCSVDVDFNLSRFGGGV